MSTALPAGAVKQLQGPLNACERLFDMILSSSLHSVDGTIAYPQRVTFVGGGFWIEALSGGAIAALPLKDVLANWKFGARSEGA